MPALLILLFLLGLNYRQPNPEDKCPLFKEETISLYEPGELYGITMDGNKIKYTVEVDKNGKLIYKSLTTATTTLMFNDGKLQPYVKTGEKIDKDAIEFNKKVVSCREVNNLTPLKK